MYMYEHFNPCRVTLEHFSSSEMQVSVMSSQSQLTFPENVMMLKRESLSEAFVSRVWISRRFTDPRTALMFSELSRTKVMLQLCVPRNCGIRAVAVCLDVILTL